jgi:preprotein translocase subunit SecG
MLLFDVIAKTIFFLAIGFFIIYFIMACVKSSKNNKNNSINKDDKKNS